MEVPETRNPAGGPGFAGLHSESDISAQQEHTADRSRPHRMITQWRLIGGAATDRRLSRTDVAVLWCICERINEKLGYAWPKYETIADDAKVNRASVTRALQTLVKLGYLVRQTSGPTKSNRYLLPTGADLHRCSYAPMTATGATLHRCDDAPDTGADLRLSTGAGLHPEPALRSNLFIEPEEEQKHSPTSAETVDAQTDASDPRSDEHAVETSTAAVQSTPRADRFAEFWTQYPRREGKKRAAALWKRSGLDRLADRILIDVARRYAGTDLQFVPHASTYLQQERWTDDLVTLDRHDGESLADRAVRTIIAGGALDEARMTSKTGQAIVELGRIADRFSEAWESQWESQSPTGPIADVTHRSAEQRQPIPDDSLENGTFLTSFDIQERAYERARQRKAWPPELIDKSNSRLAAIAAATPAESDDDIVSEVL